MMNKSMDTISRFSGLLSRLLFLLICAFVFVACSSGSSNNSNNGSSEPSHAEAGAIQFSTVGKSLQLDATQSSGSNITYHWTLRSTPDGSVARISDFEVAKPTLVVDQPGTYVAQLIVMNDAEATAKDFTTINVAATQPGNSTAVLNHDGVTQDCHSCHNGETAIGQPIVHIATTEQCVVCHSVTAWSPNINIDHNEILGTCSYCHDGVKAVGQPASHMVTNAECNQCHNAGTTFTFAILPTSLSVGITEDEDDDDDSGSGSSDDDDDSGSEEDDHPPIGDLMCVDCHNNVIEEGKDANHILTTDMCEACHNTDDFEPAITVDHTQVIGECSSCHNNIIAQGMSPGHIPTTAECNVCHTTEAWLPASGGNGTFDHSTLDPTTLCTTCHDGVAATGKSPNHIMTNADCDVCHTTAGWLPAIGGVGPFDHSTLAPGTMCTSCHDGTTATGLTPNHIPTTAECDVCHSTTAWLPAGGNGTFDHSTLDPAALCETCHNGTTASGMSPNHLMTNADCAVCHSTVAWLPAIGAGPFDHSVLDPTTQCMACHDGVTATGKSLAHIQTNSDCDVCHVTNTWLILMQL